MINARHFRELVVRPTLEMLGLHSAAAESLLLGTAAHESKLSYLCQLGGGPALGVYQIEPATHSDVWRNFLRYRAGMAAQVWRIASRRVMEGMDRDIHPPHDELVTNLAYATAIARLVYYRARPPLPNADDLRGLGNYWKAHYNTASGKGTPEQWVAAYKAAEGIK